MDERTNVYETMIIFDSNRYARERAGLAQEIEKMIQAEKGDVLVSRLWEERRLAYPINGQRKGTYWLSYFRLESRELVNFNRETSLNESIMRSLVLKVDPRIVDALVSHALQSPQEARARREAAPVVAVPVEAGNAAE